jgi:DNA-binding transcriptional regulator YdaS (Cro superfamily)
VNNALVMTSADLVNALSQSCDSAGSQSAWARKVGVSVSQVCDTLAGRREPSESIINALGYSRVTRYVQMKASS